MTRASADDSRLATLDDVARAAGVSLATASRVLNGSTRKVADSYRVRVEAAAASLGYSANLSAQATARGRGAVVDLLVADIADPYFGEIAAGVARGADEAGLIVTMAVTERDPEREVRLLRTLRGQRPRGVILAASRAHASAAAASDLRRELALLERSGGRVVTIGAGLEGVRAVTFDHHGAAAALAGTLVERGYTEAVLLAAAEGVVTSDLRLSGFVSGFLAAGGRPPRVYRGGFSRDAGRDLMARVLDEPVADGTLVWGVSDVVAVGAMRALRDAGRTPGVDVAVAGFDGIALTRDVSPSLTTVRVPLEEIGYRALRAAVDAQWPPDEEPLDYEVVVGESTPRR